MPADADVICEIYLSSKLSSNKTSSTSSLQQQSQHQQSQQSSATNQNINNYALETIDFVKYTKNPMSDCLKIKYELLSTNHQKLSNVSQTSTINNNSTTTITSTTSSISAASTSTNEVLGENSSSTTLMVNKSAAWLDLNWSKIRKNGIGLLNLGNNCYLNATLQCLAYTPPLSQWLVTKPHSPACRFRQAKGFCSLCEVERIIFDIFNSPGYGCAKPNSLCFNIKSKHAISINVFNFDSCGVTV